CNILYNLATFISKSAIIGKLNKTPVFSSTAFTHAICEWILSILNPISLVLCFSKKSLSLAKPVISVVHTGVKSAGCENRITQLPLLNSENLRTPVVVTTSKSGAISPANSWHGVNYLCFHFLTFKYLYYFSYFNCLIQSILSYLPNSFSRF